MSGNILSISKLISGESQREYANCINVCDGVATYTDGFSLLKCDSIIPHLKNGLYDQNLCEFETKYPRTEGLIPKQEPVEIDSRALLSLLDALKVNSKKRMFIGIDSAGNSVVSMSVDQIIDSHVVFSANCIKKFLSAVPRAKQLKAKAYIYPEDGIRLCIKCDEYSLYFVNKLGGQNAARH